MLEHHFADSSFIKHIHWEDDSTLIVTFSTNSVWAYYEVPKTVFYELTKAESIGAYFNKNIRSNYSSEVLFKLSKDSKIIYSKDIQIGQEEEEQKA